MPDNDQQFDEFAAFQIGCWGGFILLAALGCFAALATRHIVVWTACAFAIVVLSYCVYLIVLFRRSHRQQCQQEFETLIAIVLDQTRWALMNHPDISPRTFRIEELEPTAGSLEKRLSLARASAVSQEI